VAPPRSSSAAPAPGGTPEEQLRRACAELSRRLRSGDDCRAEQFFDAYPSLASSADHALELIYVEFITRRELGQNPDPAEWYARFPQWQDQLRRRLQGTSGAGDSEAPDPSTVEQSSACSAPQEAAAPNQAVRFGRYEVIEPLGRGGMGVVYKARDLVLGRIVALKMIRTGLLALPQEIERFYREARAAALFQHPHIVTLFDVGREGDQHYLTMAFAPGGSLTKHPERFGGDPREIATLTEKIARAVHFAHTKGILHRDLKPGNILLDEHGEPLVSDFGLAKFIDSDAALTQPGDFIGTPAYMAPEQAARLPETITARTDVWSLGVLLYELLTGRRPFAGKGSQEVTQQILTADPPKPRTVRPGLDRGLETIVLQCLEKEPARRYASAEALADDLARWLRAEPIAARPDPWPRRTWRKLRRHPSFAAVLVLVGTLALAAAVLWHGFKDRPAGADGPPQEAWKAIQKELALGRQVTLVAETGPPRWHRCRMGEAGLTLKSSDQQPLTLESWGGGKPLLMELLPSEPPCPAYVFRAEILHNQAANAGEVGLGVLINEQGTPPQTPEYYLCTLTFTDHGPFAARGRRGIPKAHVKFSLRHYGKHIPIPSNEAILLDHEYAVEKKEWRRLAVEVTRDKIRVQWMGQWIGVVDRHKLGTTARRLLGLDLKLRPNLLPKGFRVPEVADSKQPSGPIRFEEVLALYVRDGSASFRKVTVQPFVPTN
jgi:hypothetical protein